MVESFTPLTTVLSFETIFWWIILPEHGLVVDCRNSESSLATDTSLKLPFSRNVVDKCKVKALKQVPIYTSCKYTIVTAGKGSIIE